MEERTARLGELQRKLAAVRRRLRQREAELGQAREELESRARELELSTEQLEKAETRLASETSAVAQLRKQRAADRRSASAIRKQLDAAERRLTSVDPTVFYVVGHAKSGTTWLMRLLDAHPEIMCKGEGRIFGRSYKRPDVKRMDAPTFQPSSLYRALIDADYLNYWIKRSVWTRDGDVDEHVRGLTRAAIRHFLGSRAASIGKRIVGDKTPFLSKEIIAEIAAIDPESKVLHIIRDGRDVAVSGIHHLWSREIDLGGGRDIRPEEERKRDLYRSDPRAAIESGEGLFTERRIREMAIDWRQQVAAAREQARELLGEERYLEVRYEQLLEHPIAEFRRLATFLGADGRAAVAQRCVSAAAFKRWTKGRRRGQEDSTSLLRKGVVGDWKRVFTAEDRRIYDKHAGDFLVELGYERDRDWIELS